jgi:hypothetical protein
MPNDDVTTTISEGTVIRHLKWPGSPTGTIVSREGASLFVAWHGSFVEDEIDVGAVGRSVEVWADAPADLRRWRGGLGTLARPLPPAVGSDL